MNAIKPQNMHKRLLEILRWLRRPFFAVLAAMTAQAAASAASTEAAPVIDRVLEIRARLQRLDQELGAGEQDGKLSPLQWPNWPNYWSKWPNWNNWFNWADWNNWRNY